ncbi:hypothetical protein INT80_12510 [Gallibacterium anatis]|uniref:Uncharacterized protein n=1 Tax=Gallibacterium anatis TaxID=750 RepID=A0A930Y5F9_9PAST|nr:hypothetical protein [Gallibacterium anatis]
MRLFQAILIAMAKPMTQMIIKVNQLSPSQKLTEATEADIVNAEDFKDGVQVQVILPKGTEAGDTVTLTVTPKEGQSFEVPYTVKGTDDVTGSDPSLSISRQQNSK